MNSMSVLCLSLCLVASEAVAAGRANELDSQDAPQLLRSDLAAMNARLADAHANRDQVIADSRLLIRRYRALGPLVHTFGPADYQLNRQLTRESLGWLERASVRYATDLVVAQALLRTYESIAGFYGQYGLFDRPGAYWAYAGAAHYARALVLGAKGAQFESDLERIALACATFSAANGFFQPPPRALPDAPPEPIAVASAQYPAPELVALPAVDEETLSPEQMQIWSDVRDRFLAVSARVYEAGRLLHQLSARLGDQGLTLNLQDSARAINMQGFLNDAAELVRTKDFEKAKQALVRADYERLRLKSVTGQ